MVEDAKHKSYAAGLAANPDFIKAKEEGREEGEEDGRQQAEKIAEEKIAQLKKASDEKLANAKEQIIKDYRHSRKFSTRLMKPFRSIAKWGNNLSDQFKHSTHSNQSREYRGFFLNQLSQIPKRMGEIPLSPFISNVYRPSKHGKPESHVIGWGPNNANRYFDTSVREFYRFDKDKVRIKDLSESKIIRDSREASFVHLKLRLLLALGSIVFVTELMLDSYDEYIHGETSEQFSSRKKVNRLCETVKVSTPESYNATAFTANEEEKMNECKQGCQKAKLFHNHMRLEMKARRISGHGDPRFFGLRKLEDVYADKTPNVVEAPLANAIRDTDNLIRTRVESENIEKAKSDKKKQYESIIASEQPSEASKINVSETPKRSKPC